MHKLLRTPKNFSISLKNRKIRMIIIKILNMKVSKCRSLIKKRRTLLSTSIAFRTYSTKHRSLNKRVRSCAIVQNSLRALLVGPIFRRLIIIWIRRLSMISDFSSQVMPSISNLCRISGNKFN